MQLVAAIQLSDFQRTQALLTAAAEQLINAGELLWQTEQLNELYFLVERKDNVSVVFLQNQDPLFWPELNGPNRLFIHKLALHPTKRGSGRGMTALEVIRPFAIGRRADFLRLDCYGGRSALCQFYERFGSEFIDRKTRHGFDVARYQLPLSGH